MFVYGFISCIIKSNGDRQDFSPILPSILNGQDT